MPCTSQMNDLLPVFFFKLLLKHHTPQSQEAGLAVLGILTWDCFQLQTAVAIFVLCLGRGFSCCANMECLEAALGRFWEVHYRRCYIEG